MDNEYFLVSWINEIPIRYSVMNRKDLFDPEDRESPVGTLMNSEVLFKWKKNSCTGKITMCGTKTFLESKLQADIRESKMTKTIKPSTSKAAVANKRQANVGPVVLAKKTKIDSIVGQIDRDDAAQCEKDDKIKKLEAELIDTKSKLSEMTDKYELLKIQSEVIPPSDRSIDIGNGILVSREVLSSFRTVSPTVNIYARMLFKNLYEIHEVVGRSLFGKSCNANKNVTQQPSVESARRDAIICHSLSVYGKFPGSELHKLATKDVKKSLAALILEMNREAKGIETNILNNETD